MKRLVSQLEQITANIINFAKEVEGSPGLQERLGHVHAWYALRLQDGGWAFGPSKFVGYSDNSAEDYLVNSRKGADGRETELELAKWSSPVDLDSRLGRELTAAVTTFVFNWGRTLRKDARINIVRDEERPAAHEARGHNELLSARIVSNPEITGGRPHVRGTRMRVSDLVGLVAAGATRAEIVADYPYLTDEDISAALLYAARAIEHRVIRAA